MFLNLTNYHLKAKIDDEGYNRVLPYSWSKMAGKQIHAKTAQGLVNLSNFIMIDFSSIFDHKDRDFLNNQKENLRKCTQSLNMANRSKYGKYSSKYKGVSFCVRDDCWRAHIKINGKSKSLGTFMTEVGAAKAYNSAASTAFGEFAVLNKIERVSIS